jgi:uncharacterized repeat protein (TIGR02543 family)
MEKENNNKKKVGIIIAIVVTVLLILGLVLFLVLRNKKIIITFDSNGGTTVEVQKIKKGGTINIPESTKEGFTLDGWYIEEQKVTSSTTFNKNTTVKAKWTTNKPKSYKVTFDSKEGSKVEPIEVECNKELKLPENPTKEGYTFVSWIDKNETPILDEALLSCEDITLYANWEKKEDAKKYYTVKFDSKGGSNINAIQVECNTKLKLPTTKPTRTGYEFISWYDKNGKTILDGALLSCEDITLYADWKKIEEKKETKYFTITFDSQGGSKVDPKKYECDKQISSLPTPTRKNYTFISWYDKNGKTILTGALLSCDNITLYADWSENKPSTPEKQYKCPSGYTLKDTKKCVLLAELVKYCEGNLKLVNGECVNPSSPNIKGTRTCPSKTYNGWTGTGTYYEAGRGYCGYEELTSYIGQKQNCENNKGTLAANNHCYKHIEITYTTTCASNEKYFEAQKIAPGSNPGCYQVSAAKKKCPEGYTNASVYGDCAKIIDATYE